MAPVVSLIKILRMADKLLLQIFPEIESHLHVEYESEFIWSESVRGTIQWTPTILDTIKNGNEHPLRILCRIERTDFDTPENILAIYAVLLLQYDTEHLLHDRVSRLLDEDDCARLKRMQWHIDNILRHSILRSLIPMVEQYKGFSEHQFIKENEKRTHTRIQHGIVRQKQYADLIDWMKKYRKYRLYAHGGAANFGEVKGELFTIYEYWILYEIANHLEHTKGFGVEKKIEGRTLYFQITENGKKFKLRYQDELKGWKEKEKEKAKAKSKLFIKSRPDFTIGSYIDAEERYIILDAKYHGSANSEGVVPHLKMLGYLMNLAKYGPRIGVLFFPAYAKSRDMKGEENKGAQSENENTLLENLEHDQLKTASIVEYKHKSNSGEEFKLVTMRPMSMENDCRKEILEKVAEYIKGYTQSVNPKVPF